MFHVGLVSSVAEGEISCRLAFVDCRLMRVLHVVVVLVVDGLCLPVLVFAFLGDPDQPGVLWGRMNCLHCLCFPCGQE